MIVIVFFLYFFYPPEYELRGYSSYIENAIIEFVPLEEVSRFKRQAAINNNLSSNKTKSGIMTKVNLKFDKIASLSPPTNVTATPVVKKNLHQEQSLEEKREDELVQDLMNDTLPYRPTIIEVG